MSISGDRVARKANGVGREADSAADTAVTLNLFDALGRTLDNLVIGVVIVTHQGRILHANQAAERMLEARSPIIALGGCLSALQGELTRDLRRAIATAEAGASPSGVAGVGVPLLDKNMTAATAYVLPLACGNGPQRGAEAGGMAAVFVSPSKVFLADIGVVARIYRLTPAEARLLQQLVAGASLNEAAAALGITEATARTHRNHIFTKTGVCRRTDLLALVARLVPPIRPPH
jgi:DNA-binding CsgD family transcriptional regulator